MALAIGVAVSVAVALAVGFLGFVATMCKRCIIEWSPLCFFLDATL